jgi:formamidase
MTETLIKVDLSKPPQTQEVLHNRWHPDIPMIAYVRPGDEFRVECVDCTGGQIANDDVANDVRDVDLTKVHYLSGPIGVEGAEPGDLLVVDILDIGVLPESAWGFTGIFAKTLSGCAKSVLELSRYSYLFTPYPRCGVCRNHPPRADRLSPFETAAGYLE